MARSHSKDSGSHAVPRVVLVVDDDPAWRVALTEIVHEAGYQVVAVNNGAEALGELRVGLDPALITLDLDMPVVDGHGVLAELAWEHGLRHIPVIVVSASVPAGVRLAGATWVFRKPFDVDRFIAALQDCDPVFTDTA